MITDFETLEIPKSRIATFDVMSFGLKKHHISALLEFDVTDIRKKLSEKRRSGINISFNAWIIKAISNALENHKEACSFLLGGKKLIIFEDINVSTIVEKEINGNRVPMPMVIEKSNRKTAEEISAEIDNSKNVVLKNEDIVLNRRSEKYENLYYMMPAFARRFFWRYLLSHPKTAFRKMGNVSVTSLGAAGKINGWFIHKAIHPISFGIGSVLRKPAVVKDEIQIRDILNMTILFDHDVIDGAPMVRFLKDLTAFIEKE